MPADLSANKDFFHDSDRQLVVQQKFGREIALAPWNPRADSDDPLSKLGDVVNKATPVCPECQVKHKAENEERSFPQNKYILASVRRKTPGIQQIREVGEKCKEHGKELGLFCRDSRCRKAICQTCMLRNHRSHDIGEIEEDEKEVLIIKLNNVKSNLQAKRHMLLHAKEDLAMKSKGCRTNMENVKREIVKAINERFGELANFVEQQKKESDAKIKENIATLNENILMLDSIEENIKKMTARHYIHESLETVENIEENMSQNPSQMQSYGYFWYGKNQTISDDVRAICGELTQCTNMVNFSDKFWLI